MHVPGVEAFPGVAGEPGDPGDPGVLEEPPGVAGTGVTCATVVATVPAGQEGHGTLTIVEDATEVAVAGAVTVIAAAADTTDDATDCATLAPDAVAMLAMDVTTEAGHVMTWLEAGHVGQGTATVVRGGAGGGETLDTALQLTQTGG